MKSLKPTIVALAALASVSAQAQPGPTLDEIRQMLVPYASSADVVTLPDGRQVGYLAVGPRGDEELRVVSIEGGAPKVLPIRVSGTNHPFALTADGRTIIISNGVHLSDEIWLLEPKR